MSAGPLDRWLAGLAGRKVEETEVSEELCTRTRLWGELAPHLPPGQPGAWLLYREQGTVCAVRFEDEKSVGRGGDADICVNNRWLSRRHFAIRPAGDGFDLENLGGKNALLLNGVETRRHRLHSGDLITIADQHFLFVVV